MQKRQSADTRYQHTNRIADTDYRQNGPQSADTDCPPIIGASLHNIPRDSTHAIW